MWIFQEIDSQKIEVRCPWSQPPDETELGSEPGPLSCEQTSFHTDDYTQFNILLFWRWGGRWGGALQGRERGFP